LGNVNPPRLFLFKNDNETIGEDYNIQMEGRKGGRERGEEK